jgi:protein TonB
MQDGRFTQAFDTAAYEAELRKRDEEQSRTPVPSVTGADGVLIYRIGGDVTAPVATHRVDPPYPANALKAKAGGIYIVEVIVDEHGNVTSPKLLFGENADLGKAAVDAVRQWKFKPAMRNGSPVRVFYNLTVSFNPN